MAKKVKRPQDWQMVVWQDTRVLAFDPSLANTGWVCVAFRSAFPAPIIVARGTFVTEPDDASTAGILGSLERGDMIYSFATSLIKQLMEDYLSFFVVHEVPVNQANAAHVHKAEAGPVSAMAVRAAALQSGCPPESIEVQTWKKLVTNDGRADKTKVAETINEIFPGLGRSNEHVRDALGCALGWMIKAERWTEHDQS